MEKEKIIKYFQNFIPDKKESIRIAVIEIDFTNIR